MSSMPGFSSLLHAAKPLIETAFSEDLAQAGDVTSALFFREGDRSTALLVSRQEGIMAGASLISVICHYIDPDLEISLSLADGEEMQKNQKIAVLQGSVLSLLAVERVLLNFLMRLCGIATQTAIFCDQIKHTKARIAATRKTLPGWRPLDKYAVMCGGGLPHRYGLYDAVMVKDNHVAAAGSMEQVINNIAQNANHMLTISVEIDQLDQLSAALSCDKIHVLVLDNFSLADLARAVDLVKGQKILEASGNVTLDNIKNIAEVGVDIISSGWITHSAPACDLALDFAGPK